MKLLKFLNTRFKTTFTDQAQFFVPVKEQFIKKNSIITDYGQIERRLYFINEGIVQVTMLHDGEERIIDFFFDDSFVCALTSLLKQEVSDVRLTALTDCQVEVVQYADLQEA